MKIREIINSKKTPEIKTPVVGITGKHKFNGNFDTEKFLADRDRNKKKKKAKANKIAK